MNITHYPFPPPGEPRTAQKVKPYPAPLLTSRDVPRDPVPGPVLLLKAYAERCGWQALTPRQAEGFLPHAAWGTPGDEPKVSWSLQLMQGGRRAVAVRMGNAWHSLWTWSDQDLHQRYVTLEAFKEALR